jgi:putative ABC transport system permease protein
VIQFNAVSPEFFDVLGTPLKSGRVFLESDDQKSSRVAIIDDAMATRYWPNQNPLGKKFKFGRRDSKAPWIEVAGVVANMKTESLDSLDEPHVYLPFYQNPNYAMAVFVRTEGHPEGLAGALREQVQAVDPDLPVFGEQTMDQLVSDHLAQRRFAMQMVAVFGVVALLLSTVGIYGVMAYSVSQRTREIGIRVALGAGRSDIARWVLKQGMVLAAVGVGLGLAGALALTRFLAGLLYGVTTTDPLTYAALATALAAAALAASLLPARRASRVDPLVALRYE